MHAILHYLDIIAPAFTIVGVLLLGYKRRAGFMVANAGSVLWLTSGLLASYAGRPMWGLVINSVVLMGINTWGWWRWRPAKDYPWPHSGNVYVPPTPQRPAERARAPRQAPSSEPT